MVGLRCAQYQALSGSEDHRCKIMLQQRWVMQFVAKARNHVIRDNWRAEDGADAPPTAHRAKARFPNASYRTGSRRTDGLHDDEELSAAIPIVQG